MRDHARACEEHPSLRQQRDERDERDVGRSLAVGTQGLLEHRLRAPVELRLLLRLLRERLHDVNADDVLLCDRRDVCELLLHVTQRGVGDVAVAVGERDEQRRHGEDDQREAPLDEEEDGGHRDHCEDVLEEEDQPIAEEEADALQVDRCARHQLSRLVPVVEPEREPHHVRVQAAPQVHLDVERLAAGDQAAPGHERGAHDAEADHDDDGDPEPVCVVVDQRPVDHVAAGDPDECDLGGLRADGEHDRHDEPDPIGTKEAEQANEGRPIRDGTHLGRVSAPSAAELVVHEPKREREPPLVRRHVRPAARAGRVG